MGTRISHDLDSAAEATDISRREIQRAIERGDLTARYVGQKATKPVIFHDDLVAWVLSLPTERKRPA